MPDSSGAFGRRLEEARALARGHAFFAARDIFVELADDCRAAGDGQGLIDIGAALREGGFLSDAERCYHGAMRAAAPGDAGLMAQALYGLWVLAGDMGRHDVARRLIRRLLRLMPQGPDLWHASLFQMSYDPRMTPGRQHRLALAWGRRLMREVGERPRPPCRPLDGRPLRVGYVSGDFRQHPVGFFLLGVLQRHDKRRVEAFGYATEGHGDAVTEAIAAHCRMRTVAERDYDALEALVRRDGIDLLVDLSGHTKGEMLHVFARRPAPALASWLGYWATTGLPCMDAVLLDPWHAPVGAERYFTEPVVRLPVPRFCFQPLPGGPAAKPVPPCAATGHVTFGSFNNTSKLNSGLLDTWARILEAVPGSRLLLKWRTCHDAPFQAFIRRSFAARGIAGERIAFRGWSPHFAMLEEYGDVDIALDPYPFSGGMTTCNALWMGVPVVTLAGDAVVGRQGYALLAQMGYEELCADSPEHYVSIAVGLAKDVRLLTLLRASLRPRLMASPLMDVAGFTKALEDAFLGIHAGILARQQTRSAP